MVVKITILFWFIFGVWRMFIKAKVESMSILENLAFQREETKPFWFWGCGLFLMITLVLSFASLIWLLFLR